MGWFRNPLNFAQAPWDLTALLTSADPDAPLPERHLWLVRLLEWLRHAPLPLNAASASIAGSAAVPPLQTATPILRLRHLLNVLERHPDHEVRVRGLLRRFWVEVDTPALLADFGFTNHRALGGEVGQRLGRRLLPGTPDTRDLAELFYLLFPDVRDADWLDAIDAQTLQRLVALLTPTDGRTIDWKTPFLDAIMFLATSVRALGFAPAVRARMSRELLVARPFRQLARAAEDVREAAEAGRADALLTSAQYLRALLQTCRRCADSVHDHLEEHGISVDLVYALDQLERRTHRIEDLLNCVISNTPGPEILRLLSQFVRTAEENRSLREPFTRHFSMLARKVAERSAETGEHYITRDRSAYARMFKRALGGGAVLAGTTLMKFLVMALGLTAFWAGFWAGVNYAGSFVLIHLAHWTVATKQPAMTAPAMAERLRDVSNDAAVEGFVDEVANLIRSQSAGILGNLVAVAPIVLGIQVACDAVFGRPLVGTDDAEHVLESLTMLGGTPFYAAFTGVLLFASSLIAGWVENWFVWHRLDSAIAWNPRIVSRLGASRAQRWAAFWRNNISGLTSNISLGLMLGIVPVVAAFFGLPLEVRHVTLSTGQLATAAGALGLEVLHDASFWWCVAAIPLTAMLNLGVSFLLAFRVALRSRGIRLRDRSRIYRAIRQRLWRRPFGFIIPPR